MNAIKSKLSDDAKSLAAAVFGFGAQSIVKSHPPHAFFTKHRLAFEELLSAGLISSRSFNDHGVVEYLGTQPCHIIWRQRMAETLFEESAKR